MVSAGIRELKNNLSRYMRQIEAGGRVAVTAHGRVIAELVPPSSGAQNAGVGRYQKLVAAGVIEPAEEPDESPPEWPDVCLSGGAVAELIDSDRGEP
jgi:prevent-host-death family protein